MYIPQVPAVYVYYRTVQCPHVPVGYVSQFLGHGNSGLRFWYFPKKMRVVKWIFAGET